MIRSLSLIALTTLAFSVTAFGQTIDPVGFCPPPGSVSACTTATGLGGETIGVNTTQVIMEKNGNGTSSSPWYLLVLVPNDVGGQPSVSITGFSAPTVTDAGEFKPTTTGDVYAFSGTGPGDSSMNASNLFGNNEQSAFGSTPSFFEVFVYTFTPAFNSNTPYEVNFGGSGLTNGTFLAGAGGSNPFSTPFTTAGLVNGPGCTGDTCGGGPGGGPSVPEPTSVLLFGTIGLLTVGVFRKKTKVS